MAAVAGPTMAELQAAVGRSTPIADYDRERDILFIRFGEPRSAVSYDVEGEAWIRFIPKTHEVVGIEIEDFRDHFLDRHPEMRPTWEGINGGQLSIVHKAVEQIVAILASQLPSNRATSTSS